jgi:hypothetical protein
MAKANKKKADKSPAPKAKADSKPDPKKAAADKAAKRAQKAAQKTAKKQAKLQEKVKKRLTKHQEKLRKKAAKLGPKAALPIELSTGSGSSPSDLGHLLVKRFNQGKAETKGSLWSDDLISIEGLGVSSAWVGMKAVEAKNAWWTANHRIHGASAEGPYVGATGFSVHFRMDVEELATGKRTQMEEVGVYTVEDGKIVREEFMYRA